MCELKKGGRGNPDTPVRRFLATDIMIIAKDIPSAVNEVNNLKKQGATIALVPTMGNLHEGHLTLVREAQKIADKVVVSVFVNPLQFNNAEDLKNYPRTLEQDLAKLEQEQVDLVFTPTPQTMYPNGMENQTSVFVPNISDMLEGKLRPGHFKGVSTVVNKLFNIVRPEFAMFGQKDFQQVAMLKQLVEDMAIQVKIITVPIVRDAEGLALSSRNGLLTETDKPKAHLLHAEISKLADKIRNGNRNFEKLKEDTREALDACGFKTDSVDIVDASTLGDITEKTVEAAILVSAYLGKPRLIDNEVVKL